MFLKNSNTKCLFGKTEEGGCLCAFSENTEVNQDNMLYTYVLVFNFYFLVINLFRVEYFNIRVYNLFQQFS